MSEYACRMPAPGLTRRTFRGCSSGRTEPTNHVSGMGEAQGWDWRSPGPLSSATVGRSGPRARPARARPWWLSCLQERESPVEQVRPAWGWASLPQPRRAGGRGSGQGLTEISPLRVNIGRKITG